MILIWTSKGSTWPNGLFLGSTNPRQSMMKTASSMEWGLSAWFSLIHGFLGPITHSRQDLRSTLKKCTHGGYPLESPLMVNFPHVISLHQSAPLMESLNHVARSVWAHSSLISVAESRWWTRSSQLCCSPFLSPCWSTCWRFSIICQWSTSVIAPCSVAVRMKSYEPGPKRSRGTIPLPGNWTTKCIAVVWLVSFMAFHFWGVGPFSLYLFSIFYSGIQGGRVSTYRAVACPSMSLPSTCQTQLGCAVLGSKLFVLIFVC